MRSVFNEEIDIVWENYESRIQKLGFRKMMLMSQRSLMEYFTLNYKNLYFQVKHRNEKLGKTRKEVSYSILKLRRLIALWIESDVWKVEGGVSFTATDRYKQFPMFSCQRPDIIPMPKTIKRLQAKCLNQFILDYNEICKKYSSASRSKVKAIHNLRDLRNVLISTQGFSEQESNQVIKMYGSVVAKREVNDFSNEEINLF